MEQIKRIYIRSVIDFEGGIYFRDFCERLNEPIKIYIDLSGMGKWADNFEEKYYYINSQFIFSISERIVSDDEDDSFDYNFAWELQFSKPNDLSFRHNSNNAFKAEIVYKNDRIFYPHSIVKSEKLGYLYLNRHLNDFLENYKQKYDGEHLLTMEIYNCGLVQSIDTDVIFWLPSDNFYLKKKELCEEIEFMPRPMESEPFYGIFPGGIKFQIAEQSFHSCLYSF